jgi:hypothetical protein
VIPTVAATVATVILAALGVLQVLVAAGRPYGRLVWGGQHTTLPRKLRVGSAVSLPVYLAIALVLIARTSDASASFVRITTWVILGYFVVGIAMNAISRSRPERMVMTPTCVVLAACSLALATS